MNPMFYFLVALTAVLAATTNAYPVLDTDGNLIYRGSYYVLPVTGAAAGGLNLASRGHYPCPLYVGQEISEVNRGIPVKFSNWMSEIVYVRESENLNIKMDVRATICVEPTYWWVTKTLFISAGPNPEEYEEDSSKSFFKIKLAKDFPRAYHIVSCPDGNNCTSVGIINDEYGVRRLALTSTPFLFVFKKRDPFAKTN